MGKLVRNGIPAIIRSQGREPETRVLDEPEYLAALLDKLVEEARELRDAAPDARVEEMADVYEVLVTIAAATDSPMERIQAAADQKRAERGGFTDRIWLERW